VTPSSELLTFIAKEQNCHRRLDHFLCEQFPQKSRSQIQKWIDEAHVLVDGLTAKRSYMIRGNEKITVRIPSPLPPAGFAEDIALNILYEDSDLAVINKPAGMVVHLGAGVRQGTLVNALLGHFSELSESAGEERPGIVHRLDKQTSGILVVAKNDLSHVNLSKQFQSRSVRKHYWALVHGLFEKPHGEIKSPIGRDARNRIKMTTRSNRGREAFTAFEVVEELANFSFIGLEIRTGRTHQIRVHLASIKHPVVGDTLYGAPSRIQLAGTNQGVLTLNRNFLHAYSLEFAHPRSGDWLSFTCDLPPELTQFLARLREALH
jgi:23S rRNA pseudouridine1911/1915/1917 synthase